MLCRTVYTTLLVIIVLLIAPISPAKAEQYLTLGAGWFNFNRDTQESTNFLGEWHGDTFFYGLRPVIGVNVNTDGGVLGYGGLLYDWEVVPHWIVTPGFMVGGWSKGGSIDLGGDFEFHESIELDYRFDNDMRLGAQVNHTSNAGLYDRNPGVNSLMGTFSLPFGN